MAPSANKKMYSMHADMGVYALPFLHSIGACFIEKHSMESASYSTIHPPPAHRTLGHNL